ncbi:hypothetical protein [Methanosphaera sp.]|jgi:hypothetical protein|uniref:hypothetical protein n=1 Tax=Methanosphaera sp. TaxID=2666342 RepID=UPI003D8E3351
MSDILHDLIMEYITKVKYLINNHETMNQAEKESLNKQLDSLENTIDVMEGLR